MHQQTTIQSEHLDQSRSEILTKIQSELERLETDVTAARVKAWNLLGVKVAQEAVPQVPVADEDKLLPIVLEMEAIEQRLGEIRSITLTDFVHCPLLGVDCEILRDRIEMVREHIHQAKASGQPLRSVK